ncbi:MAG: Asp-tRNA(Asn)/Glu-tRNA(Gln) amidotransferase GatCAB subunit B, partial [Candidatus Saccharicenans sp.]|nr:Asp-tRNA(Asn)/Glu-tRNA(Gln) amidotransferase GatCAB subunit B [Candidatus Saccharicenans sp.]
SFRFLARALDYEASRQIAALERGEKIRQETRGWDASENRTVPQRSKEEAHDYRYFPEPDLPPLVISEDWVREIAAALPELPQEKLERFVRDYGLPPYDARVLTTSRALADYFEATARASGSPKSASNWVMREVLQYLKENNLEVENFPVPAESLAELIKLVENQVITMTIAKEKVFPEMLKKARSANLSVQPLELKIKALDPKIIIEEQGLKKIADDRALEAIIDQVLAKNPGPVQQYLEGKVQVLGFLLGQVMKASQGQADPQKVQPLLRQALDKLAKK